MLLEPRTVPSVGDWGTESGNLARPAGEAERPWVGSCAALPESAAPMPLTVESLPVKGPSHV